METTLMTSLVFMLSLYLCLPPDLIKMSELSQILIVFSAWGQTWPGPDCCTAQHGALTVTACCGSSSEWDQLAEKISSSGSPGEARPDRGAGGLEPVSQWFYLISRYDGQAKCSSYFLLVIDIFINYPPALPASPCLSLLDPQITESCTQVNLQLPLPTFTGNLQIRSRKRI